MRFVFFKTSKLFLTIKNKCKYTLVINTMLTSPLAETPTQSHMTDQKKITLVIFVERKQNRWAAKFVTILTQCSVLGFIYLGSDVVCLHPQTQTCTTSKHKMIFLDFFQRLLEIKDTGSDLWRLRSWKTFKPVEWSLTFFITKLTTQIKNE